MGGPGPLGLAAFASLRDRDLREEGIVVAEGRLLAERLLLAGRRFEALGVLCVPALAGRFEEIAGGRCPVLVRPEAELAAIAGYPFHRGAIAAARRPPLPGLGWLLGAAAPRRLLLLPATADPENMGSLFRSAAALGADAAILGPGSCDHLSRRALRVSMGAALSLPAFSAPGPEALSELALAGFGLAGAVLDPAARDLSGWLPPPRLCLLVGNEYEGLAPEWLPPSVERITIPMEPGSDSLNAAAAAAIFMYRAFRG